MAKEREGAEGGREGRGAAQTVARRICAFNMNYSFRTRASPPFASATVSPHSDTSPERGPAAHRAWLRRSGAPTPVVGGRRAEVLRTSTVETCRRADPTMCVFGGTIRMRRYDLPHARARRRA